MSEEKTYLLINAIPDPENMESLKLYLSKIGPIFMENGGKNLGRYKTLEQPMGSSGIKVSTIFEFSSAAVIKETLTGEAFNFLNQLRSEAFKQVDLMICAGL